MNELNSPHCPECPHCKRSLQQMVDDRRKKRVEDAKRFQTNGKIPGSERPLTRFIEDQKESLPRWANPAIQPKTLQARLTRHSPITRP